MVGPGYVTIRPIVAIAVTAAIVVPALTREREQAPWATRPGSLQQSGIAWQMCCPDCNEIMRICQVNDYGGPAASLLSLAGAQPGEPAPLTVQAMDWPWLWGEDTFELHLIRERLDAGERNARAYLRVGGVEGDNLQLQVDLAGQDGNVWEHAQPVAAGAHYALDLAVPVEPMVVDVGPGQAGWWHLSHGDRDWPPLRLTIAGIPPFVALRNVERFVVR